MNLLALQIVATVLALVANGFLIFKKKVGWLLSAVTIVFFIIINYRVGLYIIIIPCVISLVVSLAGWFKWKKDVGIKELRAENEALKEEKSKLSNNIREMGNEIGPLKNKIRRLENKSPIRRHRHYIKR